MSEEEKASRSQPSGETGPVARPAPDAAPSALEAAALTDQRVTIREAMTPLPGGGIAQRRLWVRNEAGEFVEVDHHLRPLSPPTT